MLFTNRILFVLVTILVFAGSLGAQTFGDWTLDVTDPTMLFIATVNDSNHFFGEYCYIDQDYCLWLIEMGTSCVKDQKYPVLANSDTGAVSLELYCFGPIKGAGYAYAFLNFDQVDSLVRGSKRIRFAIAPDEDDFRVVRFDVRGATNAIAAMKAAVERRSKLAPRNTNFASRRRHAF